MRRASTPPARGTASRREGWFRFLALAGLLIATAAGARIASPQTPQRVSLTLLSTADLHGHIFPEDDVTGRSAEWGLAKIATLIREIRAQKGHVLLLDCGDTIQGTPLAYFSAMRDLRERPNPMIAAMNALDYSAMAVGNHEFNFGLGVLSKVRTEAKFPLLAANLRPTIAGRNPAGIDPYVIRTVAGVRVGIIGLVTPGVPYWELPENYAGYEFEGIVHAAQRVVPEVRAKSDLVVLIVHAGLTRDPLTGKTLSDDRLAGENAVGAVAETVPGIDVIFFGHTHLELSGRTLNGVILAQAKNWGQSLAEADVEMERTASGAWGVVSKTSRTIPVTGQVAPDAQILALAKPYQEATEAWLATKVSSAPVNLASDTARIEPNALLSLIHDAQLDAGHADVSLAAMFNTHLHIPAGGVTMREICALYPYENVLFVVEMTGVQLKEVLERAASYYPQWPPKDNENARPPGYDVDTAAGVNYIVDLAAPAGHRIRELTFQGKPLEPTREFRVAINHYRYYGGGGYSTYRGLPVRHRSTVGIRELLAGYVAAHVPVLPREAAKNWRIEPADAREALRAAALQ